MQLSDAIKSRKSTKRFNGKDVDWRKIIQSIDLARFTPMAGNMFSVKFILVQDKNKIKQITSATQQDFVGDSGALLLIVSDRKKVEKMYDYNNKGFAQQQAGALIQNLLLLLTEKKIDSCWIGFFDDGIAKREACVPDDKDIEAIIAMGIGAKVKQPVREKPELESIVYFDKWGNKKMEPESRVRSEWA